MRRTAQSRERSSLESRSTSHTHTSICSCLAPSMLGGAVVDLGTSCSPKESSSNANLRIGSIVSLVQGVSFFCFNAKIPSLSSSFVSSIVSTMIMFCTHQLGLASSRLELSAPCGLCMSSSESMCFTRRLDELLLFSPFFSRSEVSAKSTIHLDGVRIANHLCYFPRALNPASSFVWDLSFFASFAGGTTRLGRTFAWRHVLRSFGARQQHLSRAIEVRLLLLHVRVGRVSSTRRKLPSLFFLTRRDPTKQTDAFATHFDEDPPIFPVDSSAGWVGWQP